MSVGRRLIVNRRVRPFERSARITVYLRSNRRFTVWYPETTWGSELLFDPIVRKLKDFLLGRQNCNTARFWYLPRKNCPANVGRKSVASEKHRGQLLAEML